jgi:hypothetical protein
VHLKNQGLARLDSGFLLADVALGDGAFDLVRITSILRRAKPELKLCLELIARDPLVVPYRTAAYQAVMPPLSAALLDRAARYVGDRSPDALPTLKNLDLAGQAALEADLITRSFTYARDHLGF